MLFIKLKIFMEAISMIFWLEINFKMS